MSIELNGTPIEETEQVPVVLGIEQIPVGSRGVYHVTVDQVRDYILTYFGKDSILLGNVDNTSDEDKPLSNDMKIALANKLSLNDIFVRSINGLSGDVKLNPNHIGLDQVDNTSDVNKPLSRSMVSALKLKLDKTTFIAFQQIYEAFAETVNQELANQATKNSDIYNKILNLENEDDSIQTLINNINNNLQYQIDQISLGLNSNQLSQLHDYLQQYLKDNLMLFPELLAELNAIKADLISKVEALNNAISQLNNSTQNAIDQLGQKDSELQQNINNTINELNNTSDYINSVKNQIDAEFDQFDLFFSGKLDDMSVVLQDAFEEFTSDIDQVWTNINQGRLEVNAAIADANDRISTANTYVNTIYSEFLSSLDQAHIRMTGIEGYVDTEIAKNQVMIANQINTFNSKINEVEVTAQNNFDVLSGIVETQVENTKIVVDQRVDQAEALVAEAQDKVTELNQKADQLQNELDEHASYLDQKVIELNQAIDAEEASRIAAITQEVINRNNEIDARLNSAVTEIQAAIDALDAPSITALNQKIDELNQKIEDHSATLTQETIDYVQGRLTDLNTDVTTRINTLTSSINDEIINRLAAIEDLDDGLTSEIQSRIDGDVSITTALDNYKASNDNAIANIQQSISTEVTNAIASSTLITSLDSRLQTVEGATNNLQTSLATITTKVNTTATKAEANTSALNALTASFENSDAEVRGLIAQESTIRANALGTISTQLNTISSNFNSLNTAGQNLLKSSSVPLIRNTTDHKYDLGSYVVGGPYLTQGQTYTLIASITHDSSGPDAVTIVAGQGDDTSLISFGSTKGFNNKIVKATFTPRPEPFTTIHFYYHPTTDVTGNASVNWAVLVKGDVIPVNDWFSSPYDSISDDASLQATIDNIYETIANEDLALATQINQLQSTFEDNDTDVRSLIIAERQTRVTSDEALSQSIEGLRSTFETDTGALEALIADEVSARTTGDQASTNALNAFASSFSGTGNNLVPIEYCDPTVITNITSTSNVEVTLVPSELRNSASNKMWKVKRIGTGLAKISFSVSDSSYNILVNQNSSYIISSYFRAGQSNFKVLGKFYCDTGAVLQGNSPVINSLEWTRLYFTAAIPQSVTAGRFVIEIDLNNLPISENNHVNIDMIMIERKIGQGNTPSEWTAGNVNTAASIVTIQKTLADADTALASRIDILKTEVDTNDATITGFVTTEIESITDELGNLSSRIDSVQSSFSNQTVGNTNLWYLSNIGTAESGTATVVPQTTDQQNQLLTITNHSNGVFTYNWTNLRDAIYSSLIDQQGTYSVSFEIKPTLSKVRLDVNVFGTDNPVTNSLKTLTVNQWNLIKFDGLKFLSGGNFSASYAGLIKLKVLASDNNITNANLINKTFEIRNVQLQKGDVSSTYVKPIWLTDKKFVDVNAAITTEATARTSADGALTTRIDSLTSTFSTNDIAVRGLIAQESEARANADGVFTSQLNTLTSSFQNQVIGGSNLVPYSYKFRVGTSGTSNLVKSITTEGYLKVNNISSTLDYINGFWDANTDLSVVVAPFASLTGIYLTISFWIKAVSTSNLPTTLPRFYLNPTYGYEDFQGSIGNIASGGWVQIYRTINVTTPITSINPYLQFTSASTGAGLYIGRWKIELGQKPTDWCDYREAPALVLAQATSSITNLQTTLANADIALANSINTINSTIAQIPNAGINLLWYKAANLTNVSDVYNNTVANTLSLYNSNADSRIKGLQVNLTTTSTSSLILFNSSFPAVFPKLIPGKYVLSFYANSSVDNHQILFRLYGTNDTTFIVPNPSTNITLHPAFARYVVSFTIVNEGNYTPGVLINMSGASSRSIRIERLMLEQQAGTSTTASNWVEGLSTSDFSITPVTYSEAQIGSKLNTVVTDQSATATRLNTLEGTVSNNDINVKGLIATEEQVRVDADSALSQRIDLVSSTLTTANATTNSRITSEVQTLVTKDQALADSITAIETTVINNNTVVNGRVATVESNVSTLESNTTTRFQSVESNFTNLPNSGVNLLSNEYVDPLKTPSNYALTNISAYTTEKSTDESSVHRWNFTVAQSTGASIIFNRGGGSTHNLFLPIGKYIFSFYGKASSNHAIKWDLVSSSSINNISIVYNLTTTLQRFSYLVTVTTAGKYSFRLLANPNNLPAGHIVYIERMMLETQVSGNTNPSIWVNGSSDISNQLSNTRSEILDLVTANTTANSATIQRINTLETTVSNNDITVKGLISTVEDSVSDLESTTNTRFETIQSQVDANESGITSLQTSTADADSALASRIDRIRAGTDSINLSANSSIVNLGQAITNESTARANQIGGLQTTIDNKDIAVRGLIQDEATTRSSQDGAINDRITSMQATFSGTGVNLLSNPYSDPITVPAVYGTGVTTSVLLSELRDTAKDYMYKVVPSQASAVINFTSAVGNYKPLNITSGAYIVSFYAKAPQSITTRVALRDSGNNERTSAQFSVGTSWQRYSFVLTIPNTITNPGAILLFTTNINNLAIGANNYILLDMLMVEKQTGTGAVPSPWSAGATSISSTINTYAKTAADANTATNQVISTMQSQVNTDFAKVRSDIITASDTAASANATTASNLVTLKSRFDDYSANTSTSIQNVETSVEQIGDDLVTKASQINAINSKLSDIGGMNLWSWKQAIFTNTAGAIVKNVVTEVDEHITLTTPATTNSICTITNLLAATNTELVVDKWYVLSFLIKSTTSLVLPSVVLKFGSGSTFTISNVGVSNLWNKIEYVFQANGTDKSASAQSLVFNFGSNTSKVISIKNLMLQEGKVSTSFVRSPSIISEGTASAITQITNNVSNLNDQVVSTSNSLLQLQNTVTTFSVDGLSSNIIFGTQAPYSNRTNLHPNPSFENLPIAYTDSSGSSTTLVTSNTAFYGSKVERITFASVTANTSRGYIGPFTVPVNSFVSTRFKLRGSPNISGKKIRVDVIWNDATTSNNLATVGTGTTEYVVNTGWIEVKLDGYRVGSTATSVGIRFTNIDAVSVNDYIEIDTVLVEVAQSVGAYFNLYDILWMDTTGGFNRPKRWDGTSWVSATDKATLDAVATLGNKLDSSVIQNYYSKAETDSAIAGSVTAYNTSMTIGGNNLWAFSNTGSSDYGTATVELVNNDLQYQRLTITGTASNLFSRLWQNIKVVESGPIDTNKPVSLSFDILPAYAKIRVYGYYWASGKGTVNQLVDVIPNQWNRVVLENVAAPTDGTANTTYIGLLGIRYSAVDNNVAATDLIGKTIEVKNIQLQIGSKATAYVKPNGLIDRALTANATNITTAQSDIGVINGKVVANTDNIIALSGRVGTTESNLTNNYYTKTQSDSAISGQVQQFKTSLTNGGIGGTNLLITSGTERSVVNSSTTGELYLPNYNIVNGQLDPNTTYTLSGYFKRTSNLKNIDLFFVSTATPAQHKSMTNVTVATDWTFVSFTFTTGTSNPQTGYVRIDNNGSSDGNPATLTAKELKLEKGEYATAWNSSPIDKLDSSYQSIIESKVQVVDDKVTATNTKYDELSSNYKSFRVSGSNLALLGDWEYHISSSAVVKDSLNYSYNITVGTNAVGIKLSPSDFTKYNILNGDPFILSYKIRCTTVGSSATNYTVGGTSFVLSNTNPNTRFNLDGVDVGTVNTYMNNYSLPYNNNYHQIILYGIYNSSLSGDNAWLFIQPNKGLSNGLTFEVSEIQILKGNVFSSWAKAEGDVAAETDAKISTSAQTITNNFQSTANQANLLTTKFQGIGGAGVNLLSAEISSPNSVRTYINGLGTFELVDSESVRGVKGYKFLSLPSSVGNGIYFNKGGGNSAATLELDLDIGKYIVSFYAKSNVASHNINFGLWPNGIAPFNLNNNMTRYSYVANVITKGRHCLLLGGNPSGLTTSPLQLTIERMMVEKVVGDNTSPSVWVAGVNDINSLMAESSASILTYAQTVSDAQQATATQVNTLTTDMYGATGKISTLQDIVTTNNTTTASKFDTVNATIGGLKTPGTNLLINSNVAINRSGTAYLMGQYTPIDVGVVGKVYTLFACITHPTDGPADRQVMGYLDAQQSIDFGPTRGSTQKVFSKVFTSTRAFAKISFYYFPSTTATGTATVHWAVLVEGDATIPVSSWYPSTKDITTLAGAETTAAINNYDLLKISGTGGLAQQVSNLGITVNDNYNTVTGKLGTFTGTVADFMTVTNQSINTIDGKYTNMILGGDNVLDTTLATFGPIGASMPGNTITLSTDTKEVTVVTSSGTFDATAGLNKIIDNSRFNYFFTNVAPPLDSTTPLIFSIDFFIGSGATLKFPRIYLTSTLGYLDSKLVVGTTLRSNAWNRIYVQLTRSNHSAFGVQVDLSGTTGAYKFRRPQLEVSSRPSDYAEPTVTVINSVSSIKSYAETVNSNLLASATKLDQLQASFNGSFSGLLTTGTYIENWISVGTNTGELSVVSDTSSPYKSVLHVGNNSGNDNTGLIGKSTIPFDPTITYKISYRFRRVSGSGTIYVGLAGLNTDKSSYITSGNALSAVASSQHYLIANGTTPSLNTWVSGVKYVRGNAAGASTGAGTLAAPYQLAANVRHITPIVIGNYPSAAGEFEIDYVNIESNDLPTNIIDASSRISTLEYAYTDPNGTLSSKFTSLEGRMTSAENGNINLAANNVYKSLEQRVTLNEGILTAQAQDITSLESITGGMTSSSLVSDYEFKNPDSWSSFYKGTTNDYPLSNIFKTTTTGKISNTVLRKDAGSPLNSSGGAINLCYIFNNTSLPNNRGYKVSAWFRCSADCSGSIGLNVRRRANGSGVWNTTSYQSLYNTYGVIIKDETWQYFEVIWEDTVANKAAYSDLQFGIYLNHTGTVGWAEAQAYRVTEVVNDDDINSSSALTGIKTNATAGAAAAQQITNLNAVIGDLKQWKIVSAGYGQSPAAGIYDINGVSRQTTPRSWGLTVFKSDGTIESHTNVDVYSSVANANTFKTAIDNVAVGKYLAVTTYDSPEVNSSVFRDSLLTCGASTRTLASIVGRAAYILIGRKGLGEGQGIEVFKPAPGQSIEYLLQIINGVPVGLGGTGTLATAVQTLVADVDSVGGSISGAYTNLKSTFSGGKGSNLLESSYSDPYSAITIATKTVNLTINYPASELRGAGVMLDVICAANSTTNYFYYGTYNVTNGDWKKSPVKIEQGKRYLVSFMARQIGSQQAYLGMHLRANSTTTAVNYPLQWLRDDGNLDVAGNDAPLTTAWKKYTFVSAVINLADSRTASLLFKNYSPSVSAIQECYIDMIMVEELIGDVVKNGSDWVSGGTNNRVATISDGLQTVTNDVQAQSSKWLNLSAALGTNTSNILTALDTVVNNVKSTTSSVQKLESHRYSGFVSVSADSSASITKWTLSQGTGELTRFAESTGKGGYVLRLGNNSGNDAAWALWADKIPFDDTKTYKMTWRYRRVAGTGSVYIGLSGFTADQSKFVNVLNMEDTTSGSSHYAVTAQSPALGTWVTGEAYFRGRAPVGSTGSWTKTVPYQLANKIYWFSPLVIANYSSATGQVDLDYIQVEVVDLETETYASYTNFVDTYADDITASSRKWDELESGTGGPTGAYGRVTSIAQTASQTAVESYAGTVTEIFSKSGSNNYVINGDFRDGLNGWNKNSAATSTLENYNWVAYNKRWGRYYSTDTTTLYKGIIQTLTVSNNGVKAQQEYTLSFDLHGNAAQIGKPIRIILHLNDGSSNNQGGGGPFVATANTTRHTLTFTTPPNLVYINLIFYVETGYAPDFFITNVQLEEGPTATAFRLNSVQLESSIKIQAESIDGVKSKYGVTINNNGLISGFSLLSGVGTPSVFGVAADQFYIGTTDGNKKMPFSVLTSPTTLNGETVPAGTYIDQAFIKNGAITNALIANATIDGAKIKNATIVDAHIGGVYADKIIVGVGQYIKGNLMIGKTVTGTGISNPALVNDGIKSISPTYSGLSNSSSATAGTSTTETIYYQVDLGNTYVVSQSNVWFYALDVRSYAYKIKYSRDGVNWFYFAGGVGANGWAWSVEKSTQVKEVVTTDSVYPGVSARYFRLYMDGNTLNVGNHIYEWELWGTKVTTLDGGNIVTGTITADAIQAGTITGDLIKAGTITTDKLIIGGGNMIYGGLDTFANHSTVPNNLTGAGTLTLDKSNFGLFGGNRLQHTSSAATSYSYIHPTTNTANGWLRLRVGQSYILSAYVITSSTTATNVNLTAAVREGMTSTSIISPSSTVSIKNSDGWVRIFVVFKVTSGTDPYLSYYIRNISSGITSFWDGFMLEPVPDTATSPSPFSASATTRIDGSNIVTGTLTADKITVGPGTTFANGYDPYANLDAAKQYADSLEDYKTTTVDLTSLNSDTYYPITFALSSNISQYSFKVYVPLSKYTAPWASHSSGTFSLNVEWTSSASGWGAQVVNRVITTVTQAWSTNNQSPVLSINQMANSSLEYVYLRGGTKYDITHHKDSSPVLRSTSFTSNSQTIAPISYNASLVPRSFSQNISDAQANADSANLLLADIASDSKFTPVEKQSTKTLWDEIIKEGLDLERQASDYSVSSANYTAAYNTLFNYLTPLMGTAALMATTHNIVRSTFQANFANYYTQRSALLKNIATNIPKNAVNLANTAQSSIDSLSIGGRNIALGTSISKTINGTNVVNQSVGLYNFYDVLSKISTDNNSTELVVSFNWVATGSTIAGTMYSQLNTSPWAAGSPTITLSSTNNKGFYVGKMSSTSISSSTASGIQVRFDNLQGTVVISNLKVEIGNRNTSWSPAPEDVATGITNAELNAKNYVDTTTGNLLNNVSITGTTDRWNGGTATNQDFFGVSIPVHTVTTASNVMISSTQFVVDPSKAYEVTLWMKADGTSHLNYFGIYAYNNLGGLIGVNSISNATGADSTTSNTNHYFWSGAESNHNDWVKRTGYIMPAGTTASDMKNLGTNVTSNARMLPNTSKMLVRWLNYSASPGTVSSLWIAHAKCVEVDPNAIIRGTASKTLTDVWVQPGTTQINGGSIYTNSITANQIAVGTITSTELASNSVTAIKIAANSVTADKLLVGGGNLLYGGLDTFSSYAVNTFTRGSLSGATYTVSKDFSLAGDRSLKIVSTSANSTAWLNPDANVINGWLQLTRGKSYILSGYVRTTSTTATSIMMGIYVYPDKTTTGQANTITSAQTSSPTIVNTENWKRISCKVTVSGTGSCYAAIWLRNVTSGITTYWTNLMVEEVDNSVSTPSPFVTAGVTVIDGGNIIADSIKITSLDAVTAKIGSISTTSSQGTLTISDTLIQIKDTNGIPRLRIGFW